MTPEGRGSLHPEIGALLEYFQGELDDEVEETIEVHLADCETCAAVCDQIRALDPVWNAWTARAHGDLHLRLTLTRALAQAEAQTPNSSWRARLKHWREQWAGSAEAALRTILESSTSGAHAVASAVDSLARPGTSWRFAPEPGTAGVWGEDDEDGSTVIATGRLSPDKPRALVQLTGGEKGDIVVRVDNLPLGDTPPLVVLIAVGPDREVLVRVVQVERQPGTGSCMARFTELPPGEYIVAFEPLGGAAP